MVATYASGLSLLHASSRWHAFQLPSSFSSFLAHAKKNERELDI